MNHPGGLRPESSIPSRTWTHVDDGLPSAGENVLWTDVDGSLHLGRLEGRRVLPVTYGQAAPVLRPLGEHLFWAPIDAVVAWESFPGEEAPAPGVELLWRDHEGRCHLGRAQGERMYPVVYGNSESVWHYCDELAGWGEIRRATAEA